MQGHRGFVGHVAPAADGVEQEDMAQFTHHGGRVAGLPCHLATVNRRNRREGSDVFHVVFAQIGRKQAQPLVAAVGAQGQRALEIKVASSLIFPQKEFFAQARLSVI